MNVTRAFEILKTIIEDYDRRNEGEEALQVISDEINSLTKRIEEDLE